MDDIELTKLFVEYATLSKQLELVKDMIVHEILERKDSTKIAGVVATYYKPSFGTPNYESAVKEYLETVGPPEWFDMSDYQTVTISTKWKDASDALKLQNVPPGEEKPARVVIK